MFLELTYKKKKYNILQYIRVFMLLPTVFLVEIAHFIATSEDAINNSLLDFCFK